MSHSRPDTGPFREHTFSGMKVQGQSIAGVSTCFLLPELHTALDVAQGFSWALTQKHYFITHGHMDHAAGIPYIVSQKALTGQAPGNFYMPHSMIQPLTSIMNQWQKMEGHTYDLKFFGVDQNSRIELNRSYFIRPFLTTHRIDSLGFTVFRQSKRLKEEYTGATQDQLIQLRKQNVKIEETIESPLISYTGDTTIEGLFQAPWVADSETLLVEVTYFDQKKTVESARKWGHIHFLELLSHLGQLRCRQIVLIHPSARYKKSYLNRVLQESLPDSDRERVRLFL